jgi:serine/threonine protein kinase
MEDDPAYVVPITNRPEHTQELMDENWQPAEFRYDLYNNIRPNVQEITTVYPTLSAAVRGTGWSICKRYLGSGTYGNVFLGYRFSDRKLPMDERHFSAAKQMSNDKRSQPHAAPVAAPTEPFRNQRARQFIFMEIEILQRLKHPNIVRLLAHFAVEDERSVYLILEYCDYKDLNSEMQEQQRKRFVLPVARYYFKQIIAGVVYLHQKFVAHCDLKLENVLVKIHPNGADRIAKITDFGLAIIYRRQVDWHSKYQIIKCTDHHRGTMNYLPPEISCRKFIEQGRDIAAILNKKYRTNPISKIDIKKGLYPDHYPANFEPPEEKRRPIIILPQYLAQRPFSLPPVDVYCCGVILYVMITGAFPYDCDTWPHTLDTVVRCQPKSCIHLIDNETWKLIKRMLEPLVEEGEHYPPQPNLPKYVRPTAAQVAAMEWMKKETVPNDPDPARYNPFAVAYEAEVETPETTQRTILPSHHSSFSAYGSPKPKRVRAESAAVAPVAAAPVVADPNQAGSSGVQADYPAARTRSKVKAAKAKEQNGQDAPRRNSGA